MRSVTKRQKLATTRLGPGILASALLALLTCSVFYVLQDYGPESAIRKYNEAVLHGDVAAVNQVSAQPVNTFAGNWLYGVVHQSQSDMGRLALIGMDRHPTRVTAGVAFVRPNGRSTDLPIIVSKENHVWRVDPAATFQAYQMMLGGARIPQS